MNRILLAILLSLPFWGIAQSDEELIKQIKANPKDINTTRLIQRVGINQPTYEQLASLYKSLDKKIKKSTDGKYLARYIEALKNTLPGKKAPGITQFNVAGEPYALQDLQGKYVLVSFWATWNRPSKEQIPLYKELYNSFKDKNFDILGVSFDSEYETWKNYIEENQLDWKHISDLQNMSNSASITYGIKAIPQNILVDPKGIIIARNLYGDALKKKLEELLQ